MNRIGGRRHRVLRDRRGQVVAGLVVAAVTLAGCAGTDSGEGGEGGASSDSSTPSAPTTVAPTGSEDGAEGCTTAVDAGADQLGTYAVGREARTYVDTGRGTGADPDRFMAAAPDRTLAVSVLYPAAGAPAEPGVFAQDAPPLAAADGGGFPLVVYSHGVWSNGTERNDTLARWASAGYVVIAPTYPLSSGPGAKITDLPNQPGDLVFVTESFSDQANGPTDTLHGLVDTDCLALAGHSLGGATTLATAFDPCCGQLDVRAVVDIAGVLITVTPDAQLADAAPVPTLIVHGDEDPLVPLAMGQRAFDELQGPRWFLTFTGGDHNSMFLPPESALFDTSVLAFLDSELKDEPAALDQLSTTVTASGAAILIVRT